MVRYPQLRKMNMHLEMDDFVIHIQEKQLTITRKGEENPIFQFQGE
ncbi:hypothetical protein GCM10008938_24300 [Deinococcus roseus]|uniref:Uncharacterized protein n=1 Tax=Deinococcus roseus TaxID=392414 RepID=A0ABQ2D005_9DEIO|nr:hypothetical protein GCM10008938_24300 [Deinococcus roseus]